MGGTYSGRGSRAWLGVVAACAAVCATAISCGAAKAQLPHIGDFEARYLAPLRKASCPDVAARAAPDVVPLKVALVPLQGINPAKRTIGKLSFVAGFDLTSTDNRFGGLSGLDLLDDGSLLAVSDEGRFVWIGLGADGVTPVSASIAPLRDADGAPLAIKAEADAEGLAVNDGVALASFERDHRVLAYDIAACGAAARGAPVVFGGFGETASAGFSRQGLAVEDNGGMEGLAVTPDWMAFAGLETPVGKGSHASGGPIEGRLDFGFDIGAGEPSVVGLDVLPGVRGGVRVFSLHRSTDPLAGVMIAIVETAFARDIDQVGLRARVVSDLEERTHARFRQVSSRVLAEMNLFVTVDNFEGIAARAMPDGRVRLYVISDNNFSARQRTLLMVYDVPPPDTQ